MVSNSRKPVPRRRPPPRRRQPQPAAPARPARRGPMRAGGALRVPRQRPVPIPRSMAWAFDGFDKRHLPLDEFTAPYTVSNLVSTIELPSSPSVDKIVIVSPFKYSITSEGGLYLTDFIAVVYDGSKTASTLTHLQSVRSPISGLEQSDVQQFSDLRGRVHNLSVRVQCLGTSSGLYPPGIVYCGAVPSIETGGAASSLGTKTLWESWIEQSVAVDYLKGIPAVSLMGNADEDKGVIHATVCETVSYKTWRELLVPPSSFEVATLAVNPALEPIVIGIPKCGTASNAVNYRIVIGQQWCTRHPNNPVLRATQKQHKATPPGVWHSAMSSVKSGVAAAGNAAAQGLAHGALEAIGRGMANLLRPQAALMPAPPILVD